MTNFTYPVKISRAEPSQPPAPNANAAVDGFATAALRRRFGFAETGGAVGVTTVPLFIVPAGSRVHDVFLDVITPYNPGVGTTQTNVRLGVGTSTGILFPATTVNTAGRRSQVLSGAQVSFFDIPFAVDTTIEALVSIDTSAVTAGELKATVLIY